MPYIPQADRVRLDECLQELGIHIRSRGIPDGALNYIFTKIALLYLAKHGTSYSVLSDVIKTFECAKLEFYDRVVRPYEEKKRLQNGDCY